MNRQRGFTMTELIVVMLLVGVISAIGIPRMMKGNMVAGAALRDQIQASLRSAQKAAVAKRRVVCASQANAWSPPTFTIARAAGDGACSLTLDNAIDVRVLGSNTLQTYWEDLPSRLFFQPDGTITGDFAGQLPRSGTVRFTYDGASFSIRIEGAAGYVE